MESITNRDYTTIMGITVFYASFYVIMVLLVMLPMCLLTQGLNLLRGRDSMGKTMNTVSKEKFTFVSESEKELVDTRRSLTYWADAWRRMKKSKLAMLGLLGVFCIIIFGVAGPYLFEASYSDQRNEFRNLGPVLEIYEIADGKYVFVSNDYNMFLIGPKGDNLEYLKEIKKKEMVTGRTDVGKFYPLAEFKSKKRICSK